MGKTGPHTKALPTTRRALKPYVIKNPLKIRPVDANSPMWSLKSQSTGEDSHVYKSDFYFTEKGLPTKSGLVHKESLKQNPKLKQLFSDDIVDSEEVNMDDESSFGESGSGESGVSGVTLNHC